MESKDPSPNPLFKNRESLRKANIFGSAKWKKHFKEERKDTSPNKLSEAHAARAFEKNRRVPYKEAVKFVQSEYALDPRSPETPFAKELRDKVAQKLHLRSASELDRIKLYSADDSPLEKEYGIDALVVYVDPEVGPIVISLDEGERHVKLEEDGEVADILLHENIEEWDDKQKFKRSIEKWAKEVARVIEKKREALLSG